MYILLYSMVNRYCFVSCIQYILPLKIEQVCQSRRENDHVTEITSLMEGEWSCHGGDQFNGGRMVMLQKWSL